MIWLTARDKKNMPEKKRKFNEGVVSIYLAICLSMYPVTALAFIGSKVFYPLSMTEIYTLYFVSWLALTVFFILRKNNYFTNKYTLLSGSILGFLVPVANGIVSGEWFWNSFAENKFQVFLIDVLWILLSTATLYTVFSLKKKTR
jgi:nitrate reductase NapE component